MELDCNRASLSLQVLRNRFDQAACHWRLQAAGGHQWRGEQDRRLQARVSVHLRVGDQGPVAVRRGVQQRQHTEREYFNPVL